MESSRDNLEVMEEAPSTSGRRVSTPRHRGGVAPSHNYNLRDRGSYTERVATSRSVNGTSTAGTPNTVLQVRAPPAGWRTQTVQAATTSSQGVATRPVPRSITRAATSAQGVIADANGAQIATAANVQVAANTSSTATTSSRTTGSEAPFGIAFRGFFPPSDNLMINAAQGASTFGMEGQAPGCDMPVAEPSNIFGAQPPPQVQDNISSDETANPPSSTIGAEMTQTSPSYHGEARNPSHDNSVENGLERQLCKVEQGILSESRCPICLEIFGLKIYSCSNGHSICHECLAEVIICPYCRVNNFTRARSLEGILNNIMVFCPFEEYGCSERMFERNLAAHKINCRYNGRSIQLCDILGFDTCDFWTSGLSVAAAIEHFRQHNISVVQGLSLDIDVGNFGRTIENFYQNIVWKPVILCVDGIYFMILILHRGKMLTATSVKINHEFPVIKNYMVEFRIPRMSSTLDDLICMTTPIDLMDSGKLPTLSSCFLVQDLKECCSRQDTLKVRVTISSSPSNDGSGESSSTQQQLQTVVNINGFFPYQAQDRRPSWSDNIEQVEFEVVEDSD